MNKMLEQRNLVIVNVGANTAHRGLISPLWENGEFFFVPIPDDDIPNLPTYKEILKSQIKPYVREKYLTQRVHDDPEFKTFTYGDNPETTGIGRAANIKRLVEGDLLFFFAGLTAVNSDNPINNYRFYFIGFFEISAILRNVTKTPTDEELKLFGQNVHITRGLFDQAEFNKFWIWKGSNNSKLFNKAVLFDRELGAKILFSRLLTPYTWPKDQSEIKLLGQRARASRLLTDNKGKRILLKQVLNTGNDVPLFTYLLE
jgi:hypothetical protein